MIGKKIHAFAKKLWPINRSITGKGVKETLSLIKDQVSDLKIQKVKTGEKVFDWTIPKEWEIDEAYIICPDGKKSVIFPLITYT